MLLSHNKFVIAIFKDLIYDGFNIVVIRASRKESWRRLASFL